VLVARFALAGVVATASLVLSGCGLEDNAVSDTRNDQRTDRTVAEPTIIRTPVRVEEAPATVPLPGVTGGPQGEAPEPGVTFSPGPGGEQAETDEG